MYIDPNTGGMLFFIFLGGAVIVIAGCILGIVLGKKYAKGRIARQTWWVIIIVTNVVSYLIEPLIPTSTRSIQNSVFLFISIILELILAEAAIIVSVVV